MKIIALIGPSECGKTSTLNLVYDKLVKNASVTNPKIQLGGDPRDFSTIIVFNELKIAIFTMGDYSYGVIGAIKWALDNNCDILIVACNDRFIKPFKEFNKFPNFQIRKEKLSNSKDFNIENESIANQIIDFLV